MAELIPLEYRIEVARKALVSRWMFVGVVAGVLAAGSLVGAFGWQRQKAQILAARSQEYQKQLELVKRGQEIQRQREQLAARMQKIQALRDDNILLSLLSSVSQSLSDNDCLSYLQIDAHTRDQGKTKGAGPVYLVRMQGITSNDSTHSKFLERLTEIGKKSDPPLNVPMGEKQLRKVIDTEVTYFDITCDPPDARGK